MAIGIEAGKRRMWSVRGWSMPGIDDGIPCSNVQERADLAMLGKGDARGWGDGDGDVGRCGSSSWGEASRGHAREGVLGAQPPGSGAVQGHGKRTG